MFSECSLSLAQLFSIDYMYQLSSLLTICISSHMLNYVASHLLTCPRAVEHMQGTEFTLARVPNINNLYHIQCQSMLIN